MLKTTFRHVVEKDRKDLFMFHFKRFNLDVIKAGGSTLMLLKAGVYMVASDSSFRCDFYYTYSAFYDKRHSKTNVLPLIPVKYIASAAYEVFILQSASLKTSNNEFMH